MAKTPSPKRQSVSLVSLEFFRFLKNIRASNFLFEREKCGENTDNRLNCTLVYYYCRDRHSPMLKKVTSQS